jgi:hypothetical protein
MSSACAPTTRTSSARPCGRGLWKGITWRVRGSLRRPRSGPAASTTTGRPRRRRPARQGRQAIYSGGWTRRDSALPASRSVGRPTLPLHLRLAPVRQLCIGGPCSVRRPRAMLGAVGGATLTTSAARTVWTHRSRNSLRCWTCSAMIRRSTVSMPGAVRCRKTRAWPSWPGGLAAVDQLAAERGGSLATLQRDQARLGDEIDVLTREARTEEDRAASGKVTSPRGAQGRPRPGRAGRPRAGRRPGHRGRAWSTAPRPSTRYWSRGPTEGPDSRSGQPNRSDRSRPSVLAELIGQAAPGKLHIVVGEHLVLGNAPLERAPLPQALEQVELDGASHPSSPSRHTSCTCRSRRAPHPPGDPA